MIIISNSILNVKGQFVLKVEKPFLQSAYCTHDILKACSFTAKKIKGYKLLDCGVWARVWSNTSKGWNVDGKHKKKKIKTWVFLREIQKFINVSLWRFPEGSSNRIKIDLEWSDCLCTKLIKDIVIYMYVTYCIQDI